ncbi:MAG: TolC family outer membrane protein [Paracoccaceae bacterium]
MRSKTTPRPRAHGRRVVPLALAALATPLATPVAPAAAQSLADTLVTAYRNSPDLAGARSSVVIADELAEQARAQRRPDINGSAELSVRFDEFNDVVYPTSLALTLNQALYTGGQITNTISAAETRTEAQILGLEATEQDVLLNAVTAHQNVLRDAAFVQLGIKNVRVLSEQLRAARERFEVGEVTRTDVEQARAQVAGARANLAASRGALASSRESYRRVVGVLPGDLEPPPPLPEIPATREAAVGVALVREPTLRAARLSREAAGFDVRAAIGQLLPQLSLTAQASRTDTFEPNRSDNPFAQGTIRDRDTGSIGLTLSIPFYQGGANYAEVRENQARVAQSVSDITAQERLTIEQVAAAYAQRDVARASIEAGRLEVEASRLAFEGVVEEARVGARTTLDVLDAEADVLDAESDLVEARRDETVAVYTILAAIGLLTVEHLGLAVDPAAPAIAEAISDSPLFGYDPSEDTVWTTRWRP